MPGVQTLLPVMLNHVNDGKLTLEQLMNSICENPVKIFGIHMPPRFKGEAIFYPALLATFFIFILYFFKLKPNE